MLTVAHHFQKYLNFASIKWFIDFGNGVSLAVDAVTHSRTRRL